MMNPKHKEVPSGFYESIELVQTVMGNTRAEARRLIEQDSVRVISAEAGDPIRKVLPGEVVEVPRLRYLFLRVGLHKTFAVYGTDVSTICTMCLKEHDKT